MIILSQNFLTGLKEKLKIAKKEKLKLTQRQKNFEKFAKYVNVNAC